MMCVNKTFCTDLPLEVILSSVTCRTPEMPPSIFYPRRTRRSFLDKPVGWRVDEAGRARRGLVGEDGGGEKRQASFRPPASPAAAASARAGCVVPAYITRALPRTHSTNLMPPHSRSHLRITPSSLKPYFPNSDLNKY